MIRTDLGPVTAYAYAVAHGYTGTEEQFATLQANSANNAQLAATSASNAAVSETNAANSASAAAASAASAASEVQTAVANMLDDTLSISGKAADAKKAGDEIADLKSALHDTAYDILSIYGTFAERINSGVTFTPISNGFSVSGTATANTFNNIYADPASLPDGVVPGSDILLSIEADTNLYLVLIFFDSNGNAMSGYPARYNSNEIVSVPVNAAGFVARAQVVDGTTYNNNIIKMRIYPSIINNIPYVEIKNQIANSNSNTNTVKSALTSGCVDLVPLYGAFVGRTVLGVTITPIDNGFSVDGTATSDFLNNIYFGVLPDGITPGERVYFAVDADSDLYVRVNWLNDNDTTIDYKLISTNDWLVVPAGATKMVLQIRGYANTTYDSAKITVRMYHNPVPSLTAMYNGTINATRPTLTSGETFELATINNKKNAEIIFRANYTDGAIDFEVGQGKTGAFGSCVRITDTEYFVYGMSNGTKTVSRTGEHSLTLSGFVSIIVFVRENSQADFIFSTATGRFELTGFPWYGTSQKPYVTMVTGSLSGIRFKYHMGDYDKKIYAYGDSYMTLGVENRWPYYITNLGFNPWLVDGYGSRYSADAILSFRTEMRLGRPAYVLWAMGMNDSDTADTVNASWKSCVDEVISFCNAHGITVILATIPCTSTRNNEPKNAYVKASGKRYIDFAAAVNGESYGSTWYAGMLSDDNVHPNPAGAFALATQALLDFPELCEQI